MEKREQAVGSSDPEDEDVETDEVKAKQLADQEVKTFLWKNWQDFKMIIISFWSFFSSHNNVQSILNVKM